MSTIRENNREYMKGYERALNELYNIEPIINGMGFDNDTILGKLQAEIATKALREAQKQLVIAREEILIAMHETEKLKEQEDFT